MQRYLIATGAALGCLGLVGTAQAANSPLIVWQGGVTITSVSAGCASLSTSPGDLLTSVFRPRLQPDEPSSGFSLLGGRSSQIFFNASTSSNDQMIGRGTFVAHYMSTRATAVPNSNTPSFTGNYNFKVKPTLITATTQAITITGTLTNYFNVTACTVGFAGAYQPRGD